MRREELEILLELLNLTLKGLSISSETGGSPDMNAAFYELSVRVREIINSNEFVGF